MGLKLVPSNMMNLFQFVGINICFSSFFKNCCKVSPQVLLFLKTEVNWRPLIKTDKVKSELQRN
jgi:hypothetical protein